MVEFIRDPETGILYAYENGRLKGPIITMGDDIIDDEIPAEPSQDLIELKREGYATI